MKRRLITLSLIALVFAAGFLVGQQKKRAGAGQPKTIIHFVSLKWRDGVPEAEKQKAIEGITHMANQIPGVKNVWVKTIRAQTPFTAVFALEFVDQDAADDYRDHPAHAAWEKQYLNLRDNSLSGQATN